MEVKAVRRRFPHPDRATIDHLPAQRAALEAHDIESESADPYHRPSRTKNYHKAQEDRTESSKYRAGDDKEDN